MHIICPNSPRSIKLGLNLWSQSLIVWKLSSTLWSLLTAHSTLYMRRAWSRYSNSAVWMNKYCSSVWTVWLRQFLIWRSVLVISKCWLLLIECVRTSIINSTPLLPTPALQCINRGTAPSIGAVTLRTSPCISSRYSNKSEGFEGTPWSGQETNWRCITLRIEPGWGGCLSTHYNMILCRL